MEDDVPGIAEFYATRQGRMTAHLLCRRIRDFWPRTARERVLGLGYATPFLDLWRGETSIVSALFDASPSVARTGRGAAHECVADPRSLPFDDLSFDRVLLVHALELTEDSSQLLRAVWKVMKDDGRLIVIVPNRAGLWAHGEHTPFGQGTPFSARQIGRRLAEALFRVERRESALVLPPFRLAPIMRTAPMWERLGTPLLDHVAGVHVLEAVKDVYAALPAPAQGSWAGLSRRLSEAREVGRIVKGAS